MKKLLAVPLVTFSSWGWAQQLSAVAPAQDSYFGLFILGAVAIVGGLIYLKVKKPATFAKVLGVAQKVEHEAVDAYHKVADKSPATNAIERATFGPAAPVSVDPEAWRETTGIHPLDAKIAELRAAIFKLTPQPPDPRLDEIATLEAQLAELQAKQPPPPVDPRVAEMQALQHQLDEFRVKYGVAQAGP